MSLLTYLAITTSISKPVSRSSGSLKMKSFAVGPFRQRRRGRPGVVPFLVLVMVALVLLTSTFSFSSAQAFTNPNYYEVGDPCSAVLKSGKRRPGNCQLAADCKSLGPGNAYQFNLWESTCFFTVTDPVLCCPK